MPFLGWFCVVIVLAFAGTASARHEYRWAAGSGGERPSTFGGDRKGVSSVGAANPSATPIPTASVAPSDAPTPTSGQIS